MAKKESSLINMLIALLVIAVISGGILGLVYSVTEKPIAEVEKQKNKAAIDSVLQKDGVVIDKIVIVERNQMVYNLAYTVDGQYVGTAVKTFSNKGFNGKIKLMVGVLDDGTINKVSVLSQNETPGLGANMENPKFKDQFNGKNPDNGFRLEVKKNDTTKTSVDAITAATISSRAFTDAVKTACDSLKINKEELFTIIEVLKNDTVTVDRFMTIQDSTGLVYNMAYTIDGRCVGSAIKTSVNGCSNEKVNLMIGIFNDGSINRVLVLFTQKEKHDMSDEMECPEIKKAVETACNGYKAKKDELMKGGAK